MSTFIYRRLGYSLHMEEVRLQEFLAESPESRLPERAFWQRGFRKSGDTVRRATNSTSGPGWEGLMGDASDFHPGDQSLTTK